MGLALFADRFLVRDSGHAVDLATGDTVSLKPITLADRRTGEAWAARCVALMSVWHPHLVALADHGLAGKDALFEAVVSSPGTPWPLRDANTARALLSAVGFLHAQRRSAGTLSWSRVVEHDGRPALLPDAETGVRWEEEAGQGSVPVAESEVAQLAALIGRTMAARGRVEPAPAQLAERDCRETLERLVEVFDTGLPARPRVVPVALPADGRRTVLLRQIARAARLRGYVPLASSLLESPSPGAGRHELREALADRHVLLIHDRRRGESEDALALFLVALGVSNSRPHVVAVVGDASVPATLHARERPAQYQARPLPEAHSRETSRLRLAGAAVVHDATAARAQSNLGAASTLSASGRHARAERLLRESLGAFSRRGDSLGAGWGAMVLGALLLVRGRAVEAGSLFETARRHFDRAGAVPAAGRCAVYTALAWTDIGRLEEAEAAGRAAALAARETGDAELRRQASVAVARCLLWQGRFGEGLEALEEAEAAPAATVRASKVAEAPAPFEVALPDHRLPGWLAQPVASACLRARLFLALDDLPPAGRAAAEARERAETAGQQGGLAAAATAQLRVYAALGDADAAERALARGLTAARAGHEPLRALRLRLAWLEALARSRRPHAAAAVVTRLRRLDPRRLPWVVQRQLDSSLALAVPGPASPLRTIGRRPVARLLPAPRPSPVLSGAWLLHDVAEVLAACQGPEEEETVVREVTGRLRRKHRLAMLASLGVENGLQIVLASDGSPPVPDAAARRAIDLGRPLPPEAFASRREAAVPIRYAGAVAGALAARWAADVEPDWARTGAVLSAAAAALAPAVRAAVDRRAAAGAARGAPQDEIARAAGVPFSVLVEGESGTGKELVARALHQRGPRRHRRLCALNCAALNDELFEAELFGHARGAFTGAVAERKGLFEEADGGTLVLDEVGELTPRAQAKLLRAIQEGEVRRIGENFARAVDVRLVASTNRPLRQAVEEGRFRRDLLYRLDVVRIVVPPLRDRIEDIPPLAAHFWAAATARLGSRATLSPSAVMALARYDWPGNIRELQNVIAALAVAAGKKGSVGGAALPAVIAGGAARVATTLEQARAVFEARFVRAALARNGGRRGDAARELGISRQGLAKLLARLSITA